MPLTHKQQQQIWDEEHRHPFVLLQMNSKEASSGVLQFIDWIKKGKKLKGLKGIELCCGKGRNVIKLAELGIDATGIDFSPAAIKEANKRAQEAKVSNRANFLIHDVTLTWPFKSNSFDLAIDCFATTDIETSEGRKIAVKEMIKVLKLGGFLLTYLLSPEDEFHKEMLKKFPAKEKNAFIHPTTGKFEKTFDRDEILHLYNGLKLVKEKRVEKKTVFFGKEYNCYHY